MERENTHWYKGKVIDLERQNKEWEAKENERRMKEEQERMEKERKEQMKREITERIEMEQNVRGEILSRKKRKHSEFKHTIPCRAILYFK